MQCPVCKKGLVKGSQKCRWCGADLRAGGFSRKVFFLLGILVVAIASGWWLHRNTTSQNTEPEQKKGIEVREGSAPVLDSLDSLIKEANGFLMVRDCKGALPYLQRVLQGRPDAEGFLLLGKCLLEGNEGEAAWNAFEKARSLGSQNPQLDSFLAKAERLRREDEEMGKQQSAHFELWVEGKGLTWEAADTLLPALESLYDQYCLKWNYYPSQKFAVVLYDNPEYRDAEIPAWSAAVFDGKIRIPYAVIQNWPQNSRILSHELSHAFVHDIAGASVTPWLDEGLAQFFDGTEFRLHRLAQLGMPKVEDLMGSFTVHGSPEEAERLYLASLGMYHILYKDFAFENLQEIFTVLKGLREGVPLDEQLQARMQANLAILYQKLTQKIATTASENVSENHDSGSQESP